MAILYTLIGLLVFSFIVFVIVGFSMKTEHVISRNVFIKAPVDEVWKTITDTIRQIEWRSDLHKIELKDNDDNKSTWAEFQKNGEQTTYRIVNLRENALFEIEVVPTSIYHGKVKIDFSSSRAGTTLRITESLSVNNPLKRPFSKMEERLEAHANQYQSDLKKHFEGVS